MKAGKNQPFLGVGNVVNRVPIRSARRDSSASVKAVFFAFVYFEPVMAPRVRVADLSGSFPSACL